MAAAARGKGKRGHEGEEGREAVQVHPIECTPYWARLIFPSDGRGDGAVPGVRPYGRARTTR